MTTDAKAQRDAQYGLLTAITAAACLMIALVRGTQELEQAMRLILMTYPGERPMRPQFGSRLRDFVFDGATWENATAIHFLAAAAKKANSTDGAKLAEVLKGLTIASPFGTDGSITLRAEDHALVGYAIGWGTTIPKEPYVTNMTAGDWKQIFELEAEWKKKKNYA